MRLKFNQNIKRRHLAIWNHGDEQNEEFNLSYLTAGAAQVCPIQENRKEEK